MYYKITRCKVSYVLENELQLIIKEMHVVQNNLDTRICCN